VQHLLNIVRSSGTGARISGPRDAYGPRTLSFLSGNVPRDRRGRIAHKPGPLSLDGPCSDLEDDVVAPRLELGPTAGVVARERASGVAAEPRSSRDATERWRVGPW
jgi:hypothetical protein